MNGALTGKLKLFKESIFQTKEERTMIKRYSLGLTGMMEDQYGLFCMFTEHNQAIKEWKDASNDNRVMAENILQQQDDELVTQRKIIASLKADLLVAGKTFGEIKDGVSVGCHAVGDDDALNKMINS